MFWIAAGIIAFGALALLLRPLMRGGAIGLVAGESDVAVYRDQLHEIDRDKARGVLSLEEAERVRVEVARRLLSADKAASEAQDFGQASKHVTIGVAVLCAAVLLLGGWITYSALGVPGYQDLPRAARIAAGNEARRDRMSQTEAEAQMPAVPDPALPEDQAALIAELRSLVPTRPDELQGWELLARYEAALGQYKNAAHAQAQVVRLQGDEADLDELTTLADLMVGATGGFVSPEAEGVVTHILETDPDNIPAKYYLGLLYAQTDRPDIAFRLWRPIVESGSDVFHVELARGQIEQAAQFAGIDYELPRLPGPSAEDIIAAEEMNDEDRSAMIQGMVEQLSARLAREGGTAEEWARLINALGVLGQTERAEAIWAEAQNRFAPAPDDLAIIRRAAQSAGLE